MFRTNLTIAGVRFAVSCPHKISNDAPRHAYADFIDSPAVQDVSVDVELIPGTFRSVNKLRRLFDVGDMWSLFQSDGMQYYAVHTGFGLDDPLWVAEFHPDFSNVKIYCGSVLLADNGTVSNPLRYPLDQILLTLLLSRLGGVLVHAAGVACRGRVWLLAGRSGAGKSTSSALLADRNGIELLSDDRIVLRRTDSGEYNAHGTPWPGEARMACNRSLPAGGILFLEQSQENRIVEMSPAAAFERLMPVVSIPWYSREFFEPAVDFCDALSRSLPMYNLCFRPDEDAADMLQRFMCG